jgi:RNA polymerase sigma-70 factor (ECF subfamily)
VDRDSDEDLVERCREGNRAAFTALVVRYQRPIYNAAYRVLGRSEDANDVAQTVFLRVAERLGDYDPKFRFFSWIYRIAVNESLNLLRREKRDDALGEEEDTEGPERLGPESQALEAEIAGRIQKALMAMNPPDRVILTLRHFSDCSYDEIAEILAIDEKTVKSRLFDARGRLRVLLEDLRSAR